MKDFYCYPMVLTETKDGYKVSFPDFKACSGEGKDIQTAIKSGKDALSLYLYDMLKEKKKVPVASDPKDIELKDGQSIVYADINLLLFQHSYNNKSVTRAITLPRWMNEQVKESDMNVSAVVQEAIKDYLGIED